MAVNTMPLLCWCGKRAKYTRAEGMPADNACTKAHMLAPEGHWYMTVTKTVATKERG